jgi:hypothetical protein
MPAAIISLLAFPVRAQSVSLNQSELTKLKESIKTNPGAEKAFLKLRFTADMALTQQPNPVDSIVSEGHLANDPKKIATQKALADFEKVDALAYSYKLTGQEAYLKKCTAYLLNWAKINQGRGNPINDTKLDPLLEGYDLIKGDVSSEDRKVIDTWLSQIADAEIASPRFKLSRKTVYNNWNSHRLKVVGSIAFITGNKEYQNFTDTSMRQQIVKNLYKDGSGMDFEERDALHYHIYTLEPLLRIAQIIKRATGFNYYSYVSSKGSSIAKSVDFLLPFATGEKTHQEFVNSKTLFDKQRAENKEPGYKIGASFKPETSLTTFAEAAYFEPSYLTIEKSLAARSDRDMTWLCLLNAVRE